ncbi:MAG: hypothetical protein FJ086_03115 [Deltaproteobacteria bacterium]|nr:hypothetical protein [Deltaproteobacteria bacterium]
MKSLRTFAPVLASLPLIAGCGGSQARVYRIALDPSPLNNLPTTCYRNNATQYEKTTLSNYKVQFDISVLDSVDGKSILDMGKQTFYLGQAAPVVLEGPIEGSANIYTASVKKETLAAPNDPFTDVQTTVVTVSFTELGAVARGTLALRSEYSCTNCTNNNNKVAKCEVSLPFTGRQLAYTNQSTINQDP